MQLLRHRFEKPGLIWVIISAIYLALFFGVYRHQDQSAAETSTIRIIESFSQSSFPPQIELVREFPDWGHVGYYALMGRISKVLKDSVEYLRLVHLAILLAGLYMFVRLGALFTLHNRLNPLWISTGLLVLAANPYVLMNAMTVNYLSPFFFLLLAALFYFEKEDFKWSSILASVAVLVDWRGLLLSLVFVMVRITGEQSRLIRPERVLALLAPFIVGMLPLFAWKGIVPNGEPTIWLSDLLEKGALFHIDGLFYAMALLPVYTLIFSWNLAMRARLRALKHAAIAVGVMVPVYFIFPVHEDIWASMRLGSSVPLGYIDQFATAAAGKYKNLLLFLPWAFGAFLVAQIILRNIVEYSKGLRFFIVLFFLTQPFLASFSAAGDEAFIVVLPFVLLFALSEALVGEEGKLH